MQSDDSEYLPTSISSDDIKISQDIYKKERNKETDNETDNETAKEPNKEPNKNLSISKNLKKIKIKASTKVDKIKDGWYKLDEKWNKILLEENFSTKDIIGDGNCQFRSIEEAFKNDKEFTYKKLRLLISDFIITKLPNEEFNMIIDSYKMEKDSGEFVGYWDPHKIKNKLDFAKQVKKSGFHFQGDDITLMLLSRALKIDFVIFNKASYTINQLSKMHPNIIILMYDKLEVTGVGHYQIVGIRKDKNLVQAIFNRDNLPNVLEKVLDKEKYLYEHVEKCYQNTASDKFTLNNIYKYLKTEILNRKLRRSEKDVISNLLEKFIQKIKIKKQKKK
jgi:hypothetical protein